MYNGPEEQRVGELAVHPDVLIQRDEPADDRSHDTDHVAEHCGREGKLRVLT